MSENALASGFVLTVAVAAGIGATIAMVGCGTAPESPAPYACRPHPWHQDSRVKLLESVSVGPLHDGPLTAPYLLSRYNIRVEEAGLAANCLVFLDLPPDVLLASKTNIFSLELLTPGLLQQMETLNRLGISEAEDIRARIEVLNLRQFLWLVTHTYALHVNYTPTRIVVSYSTASHDFLTLDDR